MNVHKEDVKVMLRSNSKALRLDGLLCGFGVQACLSSRLLFSARSMNLPTAATRIGLNEVRVGGLAACEDVKPWWIGLWL